MIRSFTIAGLMLTGAAAAAQAQSADAAWPQWGGPRRNFIVEAPALAEAWPDTGPAVLWSRPLGTGHSGIVSDGARLFTMYRAGNGRTRQGPWDAEEAVVALDARTGETLWEYEYASKIEDFGFGAGPHSTPILVGNRLFAFGTNKQLHAFDARTGEVLWSHDLVATFGAPSLLIRPVVKAGYGCSPLAFKDTIICSVGGPGQSVMAFRQSDGAVVWRSGDFLTSEAAPILIDVDGRQQLVVLGGGSVNGLDPATGEVLWTHPHDPGNDLNCGTPLWGGDGILFLSSAYKAGSRAIRLRQHGGITTADELWFTNRTRFMFLNAIRLGDHVYGTTGDFGSAFLTALNVKTGKPAWQHRGFSRASLLYADGKAIILDEDGDLALAKLSPEGVTVLAEAKVFETTSWTAPTLVGTTLYARDRERIAAFDLAPSAADVSGTWRLQRDRSRIEPAAGLAGLAAAGAPETLHITRAANGSITVESQVNESHARVYTPGARTSTPIYVGQAGSIAMTSRLEGRALVAEGTRDASGGSGAAARQVREVFTLSADGATLTIDVRSSGPEGTSTSALVYTRISDVGPCGTWPTPCKRPSS